MEQTQHIFAGVPQSLAKIWAYGMWCKNTPLNKSPQTDSLKKSNSQIYMYMFDIHIYIYISIIYVSIIYIYIHVDILIQSHSKGSHCSLIATGPRPSHASPCE